MERAGVLIKRLLEQYESRVDISSLVITTQMLLNELQEINQSSSVLTKKVAVIMPSLKRFEAEDSIINRSQRIISIPKEIKPVVENIAAEKIQTPVEDTINKNNAEQKETKHNVGSIEKSVEQKYFPGSENSSYKKEEIPVVIPKQMPELNDTISKKEQSMNDHLRVEKTELGGRLKETPVKDLRKAIGINDRFVFINELFRGDENMYERSIKTINSFNIFAEAEYWIQRELKVKIGWNDGSDTVRHFDQLVRRRFS